MYVYTVDANIKHVNSQLTVDLICTELSKM